MHARALPRCFAVGLGAIAMTGCRDDRPLAPAPFATARPDDPPLTESWVMAADTGPLQSGDLGSQPESIATAWMVDHAAAGMSHRIVQHCVEHEVGVGAQSVALRIKIGTDGAIVSLIGDPPGPWSACLGQALHHELSTMGPLTAGAALMVLRFAAFP